MRYPLFFGFALLVACGDTAVPTEEPVVIVGNTETGFIDPETGEAQVNDAPTFLEFASTGSRCANGESKEYVVLSDVPVSCENHAQAIDAKLAGETLEGIVVLDRDELSGMHDYCTDLSSCDTLDLDLEIDEEAGSWSALVQGVKQVQRFELDNCSYDAVLPPRVGDTPAKELSITEVAVYQGVKITVAENGQSVEQTAPIIAGRPGVVRVFVAPAAEFSGQPITARLKIGDVIKEEEFQPTGVSREEDGRSTINFGFEAGEFPADGQISVELLETESCGEKSGDTFNWRYPETDTAPIQVRSLNKPFNIVLVPVRYNADGTGRVVDMNENELRRYQDIAYNYYPVAELNVTAREPVDYNGTISPNGAGFGEFLNWCLNLRFNDNVDRDTYYYCLAAPADSYRTFCGRGCVAGIAPVPRASDWTSRGGIGVAFQGAGEDTFVHEIGHALGRPHSPCGGANGVDPSYPHQGGTIGDWGYSVTSGQLVDPRARDYMGYCDPTWVSDYTYRNVFVRLDTVLNTQASEQSIEPTRFITAVIDIDGKLKTGDSRVQTHLPTGTQVNARWKNNEDAKVWVTPIADIDATLITIEDPGVSGREIELPGLGTFTLQ